MKVLVFGSTGMVGQGVLRECLRDPEVTEVITVVRKATRAAEPKLREVVHPDFTDFTGADLEADACFWCLGVSSAGMTEADYTLITHDYTMAAAKVMAKPSLTFIFVSGTGADGKAMWARVKKRTEQDLAALPFKALLVFRPGIIQPLHGIRSRTRMYNILYPLLWPVIMITKLVWPSAVTSTERVGIAMLNLAKRGSATHLLANREINAAARAD
jgi:uncharacterized protein YbjT (DUF2867 family)